jgi:predicted Rossmann fold flavoprotein
MQMSVYDVVVIGGGAAGLMCALTAGRRGRHVLVLDSSNKVGKKILMSGGGRCNFTNLQVEAENFLSANAHFCKSALSCFTQWDFIAMVQEHEIPYHERKHGQLFCDNSAKEILAMLLHECTKANVTILDSCRVDAIEEAAVPTTRYRLSTSLGRFDAQSLVVATGGLSIPKMGASGFGYDVAEKFGLKVRPTRAGLAPFVFSNAFKSICVRLAGISIDCELRTIAKRPHTDGHTPSFHEQLLFTHRGVSGPVALQVSNYWLESLALELNLFPRDDPFSWFIRAKNERPKIVLRTLISERLAKNLTLELEAIFWPNERDKTLAQWSNIELEAIAKRLMHWRIKPSGTEGYRTAEVTLGGIDTNEISSRTMEAKRQAGLFFIGEVLDVTGHLGGFNFQWAWASGYAAGCHA